MELQVGGIDDNHFEEVGEGEMVEGRHVEQLGSVPGPNGGEGDLEVDMQHNDIDYMGVGMTLKMLRLKRGWH